MKAIHRALLSVSDKAGIVELAQALHEAGAAPADLAELKRPAIHPIDLVAVTLYPFEETVAPGVPIAQAVEQIDIGGFTLLRAAAKNWARVSVLCDPGQYGEVTGAIRDHGGVPDDLRLRLASDAFARVAAYDAAIAAYF